MCSAVLRCYCKNRPDSGRIQEFWKSSGLDPVRTVTCLLIPSHSYAFDTNFNFLRENNESF